MEPVSGVLGVSARRRIVIDAHQHPFSASPHLPRKRSWATRIRSCSLSQIGHYADEPGGALLKRHCHESIFMVNMVFI